MRIPDQPAKTRKLKDETRAEDGCVARSGSVC